MLRVGRQTVIPDIMQVRTFAPKTAAVWEPADWWSVSGKTCVAAYQAKGAPSLSLSYTNIANPGTYNAAPGTAPSFDTATGWTFNGSTQYLTTGIVPVAATTGLIQFTNYNSGVGSYPLFGSNPTPGFMVLPYRTAAGMRFYYGNGSKDALPANITSGNLGLAGASGYYDGTEVATTIGDWSGTAAAMYIGGANGAFNKTAFICTAFVVYSSTLSAAEVATVSAAMAAL